ncbi:MAG TPA: cytochrome P450 [Kofleriaceae bacterium]
MSTDFDVRAAAAAPDPGPLLARMRQATPVYRDESLDAWVLTRYDDVARVVRDPAFSVDRGGTIARAATQEAETELAWCNDFVLRWMVFSDPPRHSRLRGAIHRAFTSQAIARLRPGIDAAVRSAIAPTGRMEVLADLAIPVPALVTAELLGLPPSDASLLKSWTVAMFDLFGAGVADARIIRAAHRALVDCRAYFAEHLARRRRAPGDDLASVLATSADAAHLDDDERIGICATLVAGAYETTTHVVGNAVWALLQHPAQLARVCAEPVRVPHVIEEVFRWDTPAFSVVRRASADCEIGGRAIRRGERLYCVLYSANRDPARYPDPDTFDIDREDVRHLGLGHGLHFCLGAALSRLEAIAMLEALVTLPNIALDREALPSGPSYAGNLAMRGLCSLPIRFDR